jgi:hypothetical protein
MAKKRISSKQPPILWDIVDQAFNDINDNFTELYLQIGGGSVVDLTSLSTTVAPSTSGAYDLGTNARRWKNLYLDGNSLYLGNAHVTSSGGTVDLPAGSTIGGQLIRNPVESSFKTISIAGQGDVVANDFTGTVNFVGTGIAITTNPATDTITFSSSGVTSNIAGTGISVSAATGAVTITNTGVTSALAGTGISVSVATGAVTITNTGVTRLVAGSGIILDPVGGTGIITVTNSSPNILQNEWRFIAVSGQTTLDAPSANATLTFASGSGMSATTNALNNTVTYTNTGVTNLAGSTGISVSSNTGSVNLTNTGVTSLIAGDGIGVSSSTGGITVTNTRFGFTSIAVAGQSPCLADAVTDTFTLVAGDGIILTTNAANDSVTIRAPLSEDITVRSLSGFDSTLIINGTTSTVVGNISTSSLRTSETRIALGNNAGATSQGVYAIAIGQSAGSLSQGANSVAVGQVAGNTGQGIQAVAVGLEAGRVGQGDLAVALGNAAGRAGQGSNAVAVGVAAGFTSQGTSAVAVGTSAGYQSQGNYALSIGYFAGNDQQQQGAVAIGSQAGQNSQGTNAVAIGSGAGTNTQGAGAIAIGYLAGGTSQPANTIILNASGVSVSGVASQTNRFYVSPIRNTATNYVVHYNPVTKEVTYGEGLTVGSININSNLITTVDSNADLELAASGTGKVSVLDALTVTGKTTISNALYQGVMDLAGLASGDLTLTAAEITGNILTAQPLFSNRNLFLPNAGAGIAGLRLIIKNRSGTYSISVKDTDSNVINIVSTNSKTEIFCDGYSWTVLV